MEIQNLDSKIQNELEDDISVKSIACCDPKARCYQLGGLFLICFLGFGSYYCYDTAGALQDQIKEDMDVSTYQFASLYSLYSWPNVVLCFAGGFIIDRFLGIRLGTILFSSLLTLGHITYAFGALIEKFWVMQLGRFIFGIGGESLAVCQNAYTVSWFKGKNLNSIFGLQLSMTRAGATFNFLTMAPIYNFVDQYEDGHITLGIALMIAGTTCIFSLACALILGIMDRRRSQILQLTDVQTGEKIVLKDIFTFPLSFWLLSVICVAYYVAVYPFIGLAKLYFMRKFDLSEMQANAASSIVYIISVIGSPLFGMAIDKLGKNIVWVLFAILLNIASHTILSFTFANPFIAMSLMGVSYSLLTAALWPMVSLVLPEHQLGTGYGIMQSVQNLGLALVSKFGGLIVDVKGYFYVEIFYILWLCDYLFLLCI